MSIHTTIRAHVARQERLDHDTSRYASIHPEERANNIIAQMAECLQSLHPMDRKRLLSLSSLELADFQYRRFMKLALRLSDQS